jgi:hypothetical protein
LASRGSSHDPFGYLISIRGDGRTAELIAVMHGGHHSRWTFDAWAGDSLLDPDRALGIVAGSGYGGPVSIEWEGFTGDPWERTHVMVKAVRAAFPTLA